MRTNLCRKFTKCLIHKKLKNPKTSLKPNTMVGWEKKRARYIDYIRCKPSIIEKKGNKKMACSQSNGAHKNMHTWKLSLLPGNCLGSITFFISLDQSVFLTVLLESFRYAICLAAFCTKFIVIRHFYLAPKVKVCVFFLLYLSCSARVSYHFAVCSSLSIAINHFDTYTTNTVNLFVFFSFRYTHAHI